jgi:protein-S-isoprenylcysteine O-methyltransferase Ste14
MRTEKRLLILRVIAQTAVLPLLLGMTLFIPAATLDWPLAWALMSVYVGGMFLTNLWLIAYHPGLARERLIIPRSSERWDLQLLRITNVLLLGVMFPLSGLDHRFEWSPPIPSVISLLALLLFAIMFLFMGWSMSVNDYFSSAIRLQSNRGQTVATGGPYRVLRHPGYLAMIIQFLAIPVVLGSVWSMIPALAIGAVYVYRTIREDELLLGSLPEYAEYVRRVRSRLIPGIW